MFVALPFLLFVELAAFRDNTILRLDMDGVRPHRLDWRLRGRRLAVIRPAPKAGGEAFEIAFLIERKIAGHRHAAFSRDAASPKMRSVAHQAHVGAGANEIEVGQCRARCRR